MKTVTLPPSTPGWHRRRARGASLVELLAAVAVLAVLLHLAAPAFASTWHAARVDASSATFVGAMRQARAEAMRRGSRVAMCRSADGQSCATRGGWDQGWLVFHDPNRSGRPDPDEEVIAYQQALGKGIVITGNQPVAQVISFAPTGMPKMVGGGMLAGTVTLCRASPDPGPARQIVINRMGRIRLDQARVASCRPA